jgi:hypothetical protein
MAAWACNPVLTAVGANGTGVGGNDGRADGASVVVGASVGAGVGGELGPSVVVGASVAIGAGVGILVSNECTSSGVDPLHESSAPPLTSPKVQGTSL